MQPRNVAKTALPIGFGGLIGYVLHMLAGQSTDQMTHNPMVIAVVVMIGFALRDAVVSTLRADSAAKLADSDPSNDGAARFESAAADAIEKVKLPGRPGA